jgi:K+-sensing histidine kinase KdpD
MAIYQTRRLANVKRDLARKEDELSRLHRAGLLISSRLRLKETLEAILQMALEVTNAHYGILRLVDKRGRHLINHAMVGERLGRPLVDALPINSKSVMGWVAEHRQPARISDLLDEPWKQIYYPLDAEITMRSELAVPLIGASGRLEGVLNLESPLVDAFTEPDSHILQALATQAVVAIQEVRLLDALQEVAQLVLVLPCHQVLNRLVELACDLLNAAASSIWMLKEGQLALQSASAGYEQSECVACHRELAGRVMARPGPTCGAGAQRAALNSNADDVRADAAAQSIVVPILAGDAREPVGAFCVHCAAADQGRFAESEWDKKVLACLAHYAALAVDNAARQDALRAAQEQRAVAETFAAVGDIAANLLHHLNNKVGTIPVRVQGIQDKRAATLAADVYLAANLAEIERSAREAMEAVHENLSHLHPIHRAPVDAAVCVRDAIANAKLPAALRVHLEGLEQLPLVEAGQHGLTLVFANLLDNAAEAMQGQGVVTIRGAARGGWVNIAVSDTGPGIAPELHDRIFDFNFSGRTRTGKLGFGLWWVKTLMARLGGSVAVESDGVHGTTFRLSLPGQKKDNESSRRSRADRRR